MNVFTHLQGLISVSNSFFIEKIVTKSTAICFFSTVTVR